MYNTLTKERIIEAFSKAEKDYRITLGRVKYFYNREQFDKIPWDKLNKNDDIMNLSIIAMQKVEMKSEKVRANIIKRMVEKYEMLDEKRAKFF